MLKKCFESCLLTVFIYAIGVSSGGLMATESNDLLPSKSYLLAHESMSTADWLLKRGMKEDAASLYGESLKLFQKLSSDYPLWQTNLVAFRINYCRDGLAKALNSNETGSDRTAGADSQTILSRLPESAHPVPAAAAGADRESADKIAQAIRLEESLDFQEALELYQGVLARNNQNPSALAGAGRCLLRLGMIDQARDLLFQWSVIPSPENSVNALLAALLCHDRQFARAIKLAEVILQEDKSNATVHVIMGVALAGMGQTAEAMAEMHKAIALNPRLNAAHYNLARLMIKKEPKNKTTAGDHYQNAMKFGAAPDPALARLLQK